MAITIRDNLSPTTQEPAGPLVINDVGHPSFTLTIDGKNISGSYTAIEHDDVGTAVPDADTFKYPAGAVMLPAGETVAL